MRAATCTAGCCAVHDIAQFVGAGISPDLEAVAYNSRLVGSEKIQSVHLAALTVCFAKALHAHLHCNTLALAGSARERSAAQVSQ